MSGPVVLRNAPPYSYVLTVPGLDERALEDGVSLLVEASYLIRFLRQASVAGVLGIMLMPLEDDSLWASESAAITGGFTWDSATTPSTGTFVWGATLTT